MADETPPSARDLRAFARCAPDAVLLVEVSGRVTLANALAERLFGYPAGALAGHQVEELIADRFRALHLGLRHAYRNRPAPRPESARVEVVGRRLDGEEFPVDVSVSALPTQDGLRYALAIRDLGDRKRHEEERDQFIATAAHELRTPLGTITGLVETLAAHLDRMTPEEVRECVAALRRQGQRATHLVSTLLDLSRLEAHADVAPAPVEVAGALARALQAAAPPEGRRATSRVPAGLTVLADDLALVQILTNLLVNAYRYGGPEITVEAVRAGDETHIEVRDNGPGVEAELLPVLFRPFTRGGRSSAFGGAGVGLALCRRLAEASGGGMAYRPGEPGATFVLTLPAAGP